jgi:hypothetical protein
MAIRHLVLAHIALMIGAVAPARSTADANLWTPLGPPGLSHTITTFALDPRTPGVVYASTTDGFFKSQDRGASWDMTGPLITFSIAFDPADAATIYAAGSGLGGGVHTSTDGGETWTMFTAGIDDLVVGRSRPTPCCRQRSTPAPRGSPGRARRVSSGARTAGGPGDRPAWRSTASTCSPSLRRIPSRCSPRPRTRFSGVTTAPRQVAVHSRRDPGCLTFDPCLVNSFRWERVTLTDSRCDDRRVDAGQSAAIGALLETLRTGP